MVIQVVDARYLDHFRIWLRFNTGEEGVVDLADVVEKYSAAKPLRDPVVFANFHLDEWPTLAWPCGFDFSPESLYERATGKIIPWLREQDSVAA
ncbi:MAG: DUF2442 domain-containing protein [Rhodocyclaceae bacterium]|jgi:hypothetical protein|nr:DUF2442 domain-containing protein [Rhodocyclaceae bacterium]MDP3038186.1 DUF2442 domain-containing protein [Rhodocyclaceae bacterium]